MFFNCDPIQFNSFDNNNNEIESDLNKNDFIQINKIILSTNFENEILNNNNNNNFSFEKVFNEFSKENFLENLSIKLEIINTSNLISLLTTIIYYYKRLKKNEYFSFIKNINNKKTFLKLFINGKFYYTNLIQKNNNLNLNLFSKSNINIISKFLNFIEILFYSLNFIYNFTPTILNYFILNWIPENYNIKENNIDFENLWNILYNNFLNGSVFLFFINNNINEGFEIDKKNYKFSKKFNVYENIYYPIINFKQNKIVSIKNLYGNIYPKNSFNINKKNNTFDIFFEDCIQIFTNFYLSWDINSYEFKYIYHNKFLENNFYNFKNDFKFLNEDYSLVFNPQYVINIPKHLETIELILLFSYYFDQNLNYSLNDFGYKLYLFNGFKKVFNEKELKKYNNNNNNFNNEQNVKRDILFFESSEIEENYLLIFTKGKNNNNNNKFFFHIISSIPIKIKNINNKIISQEKIFDTFNNNINNKLNQILNFYNFNIKFPQFKLSLKSKNNSNHIQIICESISLSKLMIVFIENEGKNIFQTNYNQYQKKISSNFFNNNFAFLEIDKISDGNYLIMIIFSKEYLNSTKSFNLFVNVLSDFNNNNNNNNNKIQLSKINFFSQNLIHIEKIFGDWNKKNLNNFENKFPIFEFYLKSETICTFYLKGNFDYEIVPHVYLIIYKLENENKYLKIFDGKNFNCSIFGFFTGEIKLNSGKYFIVSFNKNIFENVNFEIIIQSNFTIFGLKLCKNNFSFSD